MPCYAAVDLPDIALTGCEPVIQSPLPGDVPSQS